MAAGCPFLTCGPKRKGIEFCWDCDESASCRKWAAHRESGRKRDSFVSYAALERNIETVRRDGLPAFVGEQEQRERLLREMLDEFNDGRSKSYYCVAATILDAEDLRTAMDAVRGAEHPDARARAKALHAELDRLAASRSRRIALRR